MKRLLIAILMIVLVAPFLVKSFIYVDYYLSYEFIVNDLCENTDKPEMKCNGKCYLNKQIAIVDGVNIDKERIPNSNQSNSEKLDTSLLFIFDSLFFNTTTFSQERETRSEFANNHYDYLMEYNFFTPPKVQNKL
jgi:hypothetical protein